MEIVDKNQINQIVEILNDALKLDKTAITELMKYRVKCNRQLAEHPTIQVRAYESGTTDYLVGPLGIINGILGIDENGWGPVAAEYEVVCSNGCDVSPGSVELSPCLACGGTLELGDIIKFIATPDFNYMKS